MLESGIGERMHAAEWRSESVSANAGNGGDHRGPEGEEGRHQVTPDL